MVSVNVFNQGGDIVDTIELDGSVFNAEIHEDLVQRVVTWQLAKRRAGTASTRTRGEVRGGGKKPWRQKGTGRARAGTNRSPIWSGGGTTFGPKPRSYAFAVPKKVRKAALRSVLTARLQEDSLKIVDKIQLQEPKTRLFLEPLNALGLKEHKVLFVTPDMDETLRRSSRNLPHVLVLPVHGLNVYDILRFDKLVLLQDTVPKLYERLG